MPDQPSAFAPRGQPPGVEAGSGSTSDTNGANGANPAKFIAFILLLVLAVRLLTLGAYPLGSTTEPRYAEIARKMLETGNWITPWFDHGVPFWGKPPLSFWASAGTMALFGVNEFGVRLAPFLAALATMGLFWAWPRPAALRQLLPLGASVLLFSSVAGFMGSAAVMTDMFMVAGTTLSMVAFWRAMQPGGDQDPWRWLFFVGLALGLLAKGPVATVITALALLLWLLASRRWRDMWNALPWLRGGLLTGALTLPWYVLAELRTPGFLHYFIVGEHIQRFLVSGWTGDLYGQGHPVARGLIWLYALVMFLPWTPVLLLALRRRPAAELAPGGRDEIAYLLAWVVAPLLLFTAARNILEAYVLPGLPAFALLACLLLLDFARRRAWVKWLWLLALLGPLVWLGWLGLSDQAEQRSHRILLSQWQPGTPLVYLGDRPLSANFYSQGRAQLVQQPAEIQHWLNQPQAVTLVVQDPLFQNLNPSAQQRWRVVARHAGYTMLVPVAPMPTAAPTPSSVPQESP